MEYQKQIHEYLQAHKEEIELAKEYAEKVQKLQEMTV
jgi:hypothetical protein